MFDFFKKKIHKKLEINLQNNSMIINGSSLAFPLSLKDIEAVLGSLTRLSKKKISLLNTFMTILVLYLNILSQLKII